MGAWPEAAEAGSVPAWHKLHPSCSPSDYCLGCHAARRSTSLRRPHTLLPRANESCRWLEHMCCRWRRNPQLTPNSQRCNLGERPPRHSCVFCSQCPQCSLFVFPAVCVVHTRMPGGASALQRTVSKPCRAVHAPLAFSSPTSVSACVRLCAHHLKCGHFVFSRFLPRCWRLRFPNFRGRLRRVEDF